MRRESCRVRVRNAGREGVFMGNAMLQNKGGAPSDKKKVLILLGLGVTIIFVYKTVVLDKSRPAETSTAVATVQESAPAEPVSPSAEEHISRETLPKEDEAHRQPVNLSWGRDPFTGFSNVEEKKPSSQYGPVSAIPSAQKKPEQDPLILSGIGWSKNRALAIINGYVVHEGDTVVAQGKKVYKVISILKNRVVMDDNGKTIILRVRGGG